MEDQINDAGGAVFAVYTNGGAPMPIADAFPYISPYFAGGYFTGAMPPISIAFTPYSAVIDMRTGEVIAVDTASAYLSVSDILAAVGSGG
ncbi:MAG: hypothetical protein M0R80_05175 [Proteobacteria bacterium]|nr:hypothetical protein [Pseudomonadota bacterium]